MKKVFTTCIAMGILICLAVFSSSCKKDPKPEPDPTALDTPSGFSVTGSTASSLTIDWAAVTDADSYSIEFSDGSDQTLQKSSTEPAYTFTSLNYESEYKIRVKALAAEGSKRLDSEFSDWFSASTADGEIARKFASGDGTEDNPYIITKASQLALLAKVVNDEEEGYCERDVYYELANDIDLSDYPNWTPIGSGEGSNLTPDSGFPIYVKTFNSHFNGANHTVRNLKINASSGKKEQYFGLFGVNSCYIDFVKVEADITVTSAYTNASDEPGYVFAGGIAGAIGYLEDEETSNTVAGHFNNCSFKGNIVASSPNDHGSYISVGGICGLMNAGSIAYCNATIESGKKLQATSGNLAGVGGICGDAKAGHITYCTADIKGDITAENSDENVAETSATEAAGICGSIFTNAVVANCSANISGNLTSKAKNQNNAFVGGIGGSLYADNVSYNTATITGNITCTSELGSLLVGGIGGSAQTDVKRCSSNISGTVTMTITGAASGSRYASFGGVIGRNSSSTTLCDSSISGTVNINTSASAAAAEFGGLVANTKAIKGCYTKLNATVNLTGGTAPIVCGGLFGRSTATSHQGSYSIVNGTFTITSDVTTSGGSCFGALAGSHGSLTTGATWTMYSCYSVVNATVNKIGTGTLTSSAFTALKGVKAAFNSCYYWASATSGLTSSFGTAFASNDQVGYEAAMTTMNTGLAGLGSYYSYVYNATEGHLVLEVTPEEEVE